MLKLPDYLHDEKQRLSKNISETQTISLTKPIEIKQTKTNILLQIFKKDCKPLNKHDVLLMAITRQPC